MTGAPDDFERLLERCRAQLDSISLSLPTLEAEGGEHPLPPPPRAEMPAAKTAPAAAAKPEPPPRAAVAQAPAVIERLPPPPPPPAPVYSPPPAPAYSPPAQPPKSSPSYSLDTETLPDLTPPAPRPPRPQPPRPRLSTSADDRRTWSDRRLAAAAAAAVFAAFVLWRLQRPPLDRPLQLAASDAAALRPERADLLVAQGSMLLDLSEDGRTLGRKALDAPVAALGWDRGSLWSVDGRSHSFFERREANGRQTEFAVNYAPQSIALRGRQLWALEPDGRTVHQYLVSRSLLGVQLQPLDQYVLPGLSGTALAVDDYDQLWIVDRTSRRLHRLRKEGPGYRAVDSAPLAAFMGDSGIAKSLEIDDGVLWLLVSEPGGRSTIHRLISARLDWAGA